MSAPRRAFHSIRRLLVSLIILALVIVALPNLPPARTVRANPGPANAGSTTTNFSSSNRSSATFSHTVPAGTNRLLIVVIHHEGTRVVNSVTFGGSALTRAIQVDSGNTSRAQVQVWYLVAPAVSTANVIVTYSANQDWDGITVLNYTGVHQESPIGNTAGQTIGTASTAASQSLTTKNYDSIILAAITGPGGNTSPMTPGTGMTERSDFTTGTGAAGSDGGCWTGDRAAGNSNTAYTSSATVGASVRWTIAAVEIVPPSTTSAVTYQSQTTNVSSANRSSASFSHTTPAGNQRLLVVVIHHEGTRTVSGVTYNAIALTMRKDQDSASTSSTRTQIWTLSSPPVGSYTLAVTYGQVQDWDAVVAMSYSGVDQATPVGATAGVTGAAASYASTTIASTVDGSVLLGAITGAGGTSYPFKTGGGQTERYDAQTSTGAAGSDGGLSADDMPAPVTATYGIAFTQNAAAAYTLAVIELRPTPPPSIVNSQSSYNFTNVFEGSSNLTGFFQFRVTNLSAFAINVSISGTDMVGITTWTLSDTATAGSDIYGLMAGLADNAFYNVIVRKTAPYNLLLSGMLASEYADWGLNLLAPTVFSDEYTKTGTVYLTAAAA